MGHESYEAPAPKITMSMAQYNRLDLRSPRICISEQFETSASDMLAAVRQQELEGVIGKRKDSLYEVGKRTGSWIKYRVNRGQEFVIGGYIPGPHGFDSLIVGYYRGKDLVYVARVRNGWLTVEGDLWIPSWSTAMTASPGACANSSTHLKSSAP